MHALPFLEEEIGMQWIFPYFMSNTKQTQFSAEDTGPVNQFHYCPHTFLL